MILGRLPRRLVESIEFDSRRWIFDCPTCHERSSVWDLGGVRWKAAGRPRRRICCPRCGDRSIVEIRWESPLTPNSPPDCRDESP